MGAPREQDDSQEAEEVEVLKPQDMLRELDGVNICAPMVRYSKLAFRELVSQYDSHINYTPMMLAQEFSRNATSREADFTTNSTERGVFNMPVASSSKTTLDDDSAGRRRTRRVRGALVAQFAANDQVQLADAVEIIRPWVDGVDLNCGCPQKWAYDEGVGSALLRNPQKVKELVRGVKDRVGEEFCVSVKIRVDWDLKLTDQLVTTCIAAGADYLTVHGRTRQQASSHPVDLDKIAFAVSCAKGAVPVCANGDVFTKADAEETRRRCGVNGVMSARGLLGNPALFSGYDKTPDEAVASFVKIAFDTGLIFPLFHRHVAYMLESRFVSKAERSYFNSLCSHASVLDYLREEMGMTVV